MRLLPRLAVLLACLTLALALASPAFATGRVGPVWAGHGFDPEQRGAKITSATDSASSFSFTFWVSGITHEPGKGIDWVRFGVQIDPTEIKSCTVTPAPGWSPLGPNTFGRDHVPHSTGTTPVANVHLGITGTETLQNTETSDVLLSPATVHFAYVSETGGFSTTTKQLTIYTGVGVDHHDVSPVESESWGWIKALFR